MGSYETKPVGASTGRSDSSFRSTRTGNPNPLTSDEQRAAEAAKTLERFEAKLRHSESYRMMLALMLYELKRVVRGRSLFHPKDAARRVSDYQACGYKYMGAGQYKYAAELFENAAIAARAARFSVDYVQYLKNERDKALSREERRKLSYDAYRLIKQDLSFGPRLLRIGAERMGKSFDPVAVLNLFLRGELYGPPKQSEIDEMRNMHSLKSMDVYSVYRAVCNAVGAFYNPAYYTDLERVFQIYTEEYLQWYADMIVKLATEFSSRNARDPIIAEVAAGDGRFAKQINELLPNNLSVSAFDDSSWELTIDRYPVKRMDAYEAATKADIILMHWFPPHDKSDPDNPTYLADLRIAMHLQQNPEKVMIVTGEACTNSDAFKKIAEEELDFIACYHPSRIEDFDIPHHAQCHNVPCRSYIDLTTSFGALPFFYVLRAAR